MSSSIRFFRNWSCLALALVLLVSTAKSAQFTAVASGNWASGATWGAAPPALNNTANVIMIPAGITVTIDNDVTINGATAAISVLGVLNSSNNNTLTLTQGGLSGTGTINLGTVVMGSGAVLVFTGTMNLDYFTNASTAIQAKAQIFVSKGLNLTGGTLTIATGGQVNLAANSTMVVSGGTLAVSGGLLTLTNAYNVRYTTTSATTGTELSGTGLAVVTIDVPAGQSVSLGSSTTISPTASLFLNNGTLKLNGKDLTVNGVFNVAAGTSINSTNASSLSINSVAGMVGVLDFAGAGNQILNLSIGVGNGTAAQISGTLEVTGALQLMNGTFRFDGANLSISGLVSGAGYLSGDAASNLTITTPNGLPTGIRFAAAGQQVKNFTINVGVNAVVKLLSNLKVAGLTSLMGGSNLNISDVTLTLNGDIAGNGLLVVTGASGLIVNTPNGLSTNLSFSGNTIGTLVINTDSSKTVMLGSDLIIWESLGLQKGTLVLNGNDLTINGDIVAQTSGYLRSTAASDISIVSLTGGTAGVLRFAGAANAVRSLTVSIATASKTGISGTLTVESSLNMQSGMLTFAGSTLILTGSVTGAGPLGSDANSSIVISSPGGIPSGINLKDIGTKPVTEIKNVTINVGAGSSVKILTDLSILGATALTSGSMDISNFDVSLGGPLTGTGAFIVNSNSGIMVNTVGGLSAPIAITGVSIGDFGINVGTGGTVSLGSDMVVAKTLTLNGGTLVLNNQNLTIGGNIVATPTGMVRSTETSDISIVSSTSPTGILRFSDPSSVGTLKLDVGASNNARIAGNLDVKTSLDLTSGNLVFQDADLTLSGILVGPGALSGNAQSNLTINTAGGLTTGLRFASSGKTVKNFTINVGAANGVDLASDLIIAGTLDLGAGTLSIGDADLTLNGPITGTGSIGVTNKSALIINTPGGIASPLSLVGTSLGVLTVNPGAGNSVSLGGDIDIATRLHLKSGTLILNGNDLTVTGIVDGTGAGTLSSTSASDVTLATLLSSVGKLMFETTANTVKNLTIATVNSGVASIGTAATVEGTLTLTSGHLNMGSNILTIGAAGNVVGGSATSFVETSLGGALSMQLNAGASAATTFPVGTVSGYFPASVLLASGSSSGVVRVGATEGVYTQGTTGNLISASESTVNATWDVTSDIASNLKMNLELAWSAQAEVNGFDRTQAYVSHYTSSAWDATPKAAATTRADGMFSLTRNDIQSLSPFAIFDASTTDVTDDVLASNTKVFPSPATDRINVVSELLHGSSVIADIVSSEGVLVMQTEVNLADNTISTASLSSGVYFLRLHSTSGTVTRGFVKL